MKLQKNPKILAIALSVVLLASTVFGCLWILEKRDHSELEQLCRYSAHRACERFGSYRDKDSGYDYDYGVSELVSFYNSYMNLIIGETGSTDTNCIYLNQLLGVLMKKPELTAEQKNTLVMITDQLSRDIYDVNVYDDIFFLYNQLRE